MKKLILISALFIFNNSYGSVTIDEYIKSLGDDEIPKKASQGVYPGQYLPQYLYNLSYRQPEVADIVCKTVPVDGFTKFIELVET